MTKRKDSTTSPQNDMPEPDDDLVEGNAQPKLYDCTIGTANAIIGTKKYAIGDWVKGGLTKHDIRKHRRAGVAIHCDELDHPEHGNFEHAKTV